MVYSMTGFGSASGEDAELKVDIEIKSLNSKFLDLSLRLPKQVQPLEMDIRNQINKKLKRGKVQLIMNVQSKNVDQVKRNINSDLFIAYKNDLDRITSQQDIDKTGLLGVLLGLPDVLEPKDSELSETATETIISTLAETIERLINFRRDEGSNLKSELEQYGARILSLLNEVDSRKEDRIETIKTRLKELQEKYVSPEKVDNNRFEQELVYYLEKLEITEEIVRLKSHLNYYNQELNGNGSGKKLGFISQEMGREINTIGSKANDEHIQHLVVEMKEELEKIKEQTLNIL